MVNELAQVESNVSKEGASTDDDDEEDDDDGLDAADAANFSYLSG
jgi:hypothetical protein